MILILDSDSIDPIAGSESEITDHPATNSSTTTTEFNDGKVH
jgi:hypothetical protein